MSCGATDQGCAVGAAGPNDISTQVLFPGAGPSQSMHKRALYEAVAATDIVSMQPIPYRPTGYATAACSRESLPEVDVGIEESPLSKRMRYTENAHPIQHIEHPFVTQDRAPDENPKPVVWWKQRQTPPKQTAITSLCHVCEMPYEPIVRETEVAQMSANNTLLNYFSLRQPERKQQSSPPPNSEVRRFLPSCSYCERSDICRNCVEPCRDCLLPFCSFCSTVDYSGPAMCTVCLDCAGKKVPAVERTTEHANDMDVDY